MPSRRCRAARRSRSTRSSRCPTEARVGTYVGELSLGDSREPVTAREIEAARGAVSSVARRTPVLESWTLAERAGGSRVVLKAENLQRTGSFKVRGAAAKLAALGDAAKRGVIAGSAGNHAW